MPGPLTKDHAYAIAKKLGAEIESASGAHDYAIIYHEGKFVAKFGIRRGSSRNQSHAHIPKDISVGPHFAMELAVCTKSQGDWVKQAKNKGLIPKDKS